MALLYGIPAEGGDGEMAGYERAKMKRKDLEEAYDEFSEFALSSPARKIRRLDAELAPIMEEQEGPAVPHVFGRPLPEEELEEMADGLDEPPLILNEERAIVLYKPVYAPAVVFPSSSDVFLKVHPDVIADFKNRGFYPGQSNKVKIKEEEEEEEEAPTDDRRAASSSCLAVVPWVPSKPSGAAYAAGLTEEMSEFHEDAMVSEDVEVASMDVEDERGPACGAVAPGNGMVATEGFPHWHQHCMTPQISPSNPTPVMWSWG